MVRPKFISATVAALMAGGLPPISAAEIQLSSPDGAVRLAVEVRDTRLHWSMQAGAGSVIERSAMQFSLDGVDLTQGVEIGTAQLYEINETYPWHGAHGVATNRCNGLKIPVAHPKSNQRYTLEMRVFDDAAAFRFLVESNSSAARVPDEATAFTVPKMSTVWHHNLQGHYEGVHSRTAAAEIATGEWLAPPVTFQLPGAAGYAAITEAALLNYSGMALQATASGVLQVRLGHSHPVSHPYELRYSREDVERLAKPAAIIGPITTPWRVVLFGRNLNALVNSDAIHNLCPPPDPALFPKGNQTKWIRPGRAVWKYLDGGGENSLTNMQEFTRLAAELGFEHHILEGFWSRWTDAEIKQLVTYANQKQVGIWVWKHSRTLRDPQARHDFLKRCRDLGFAGAKVDFFDHEAKEVVDLYEALLREAAGYQLLLDFHGANKPTGLSRTWPNELTREAVRGMEASRLTNRATHNVTIPFTRWLAGHAEYTPVVFGPRRQNTTWAHQIASAAVLSAPLLTYGATPSNMLANPCLDMIKSVPALWDETVVLPPSEIGEIAVFARRSGPTWFLAVMNGTTPRKITVPLSFLGERGYHTSIVGDLPDGTASQTQLNVPMHKGNSLSVDLHAGGGLLARFRSE